MILQRKKCFYWFFFRVHQEYKALKLSDLRIIATLGVGGFGKENNNKNQLYFSWNQFLFSYYLFIYLFLNLGRVELVQIAGDTKGRSFALKQMKKSQVSEF